MTKDEDLMRYLAHDNAMLRALDDGRKVVLLGGTEFENRVGKRILRLCETCLKANASYVKAQKRSKDCKACELLSIYERQRERLLQEQEHQFASEEEKELIRLRKEKERQERQLRKQKEVSNFVLALKYRDSRQYDKALGLLNVLVSDNTTSIKYVILRCCVNYGLSKFQASLDDAYVAHDLDEQRMEPMIMIPAILCAMEDTKSALHFVQKLRKRHPKFKKFAELAQLIQRLISLGVRKEKTQGKGRNLFRNLGQASNASAIKSVQLNIAEFAYAICDHSIRRRFKYELLKEAKTRSKEENEKKLSMDSKLGVKIVGVRNLPKTNNSLRPKICIQVYLESMSSTNIGKDDSSGGNIAWAPQLIYTTADVQSVGGYTIFPSEMLCTKRWILFQRPTNISFKVMKLNDNDKSKSELIGSAVVASFQLLRYVRRHEYIEIQMLHEGSYKYTSAPNGQRQQQDVEILPSVCLAFSPVTNDVVVNLLRRKIGNKLLQESFSGMEKYVWQCIAENSANIRRSLCSLCRYSSL